ncbi:MAG TPA: hypothetical protein VLS89_14375, partial [Candidatus Nanopelagicales bacterium]|nr:hypothetical protein [Candidatus Nanopelagicales bacterium]
MIRSALVLAGAVGLAVGLCGCHAYDCRESLQCAEPPEIPEPTCDPAAGGACAGVFVSSTLGDNTNPGTRDRPVRTMTQAITLAQTGARRVYACAERFEESVTIPAGMQVWGGLNCGASWSYVGETMKTTIAPEAGVIPLRFVAGSAGARPAIVADVHAEAADAIEPSGSSIAALVGADVAVEILRCELVAGDGAHGAAGTPATPQRAADGEDGLPGAMACTASTVQGGDGARNSCRDGDSAGGVGGNGGPGQGGDGTNGTPEPVPNPQGSGLGGSGWMSGQLCDPGAVGAPGSRGEHGQGATGPGRITEEGWQGEPGQDGGDGRRGQGGGGGGGSRGGAPFCGASLGGASGGGGGAAGCGGAGGKAGGYGGASIGVLTLSGEVTIRATSIKTGRGGDGGNGGLGQAGGLGGLGGAPGVGVNNSPAGCDGGAGGDGGYGGGGLGG